MRKLIICGATLAAAVALSACQPAPDAKPDDPRMAQYEELTGHACRLIYDLPGRTAEPNKGRTEVLGYRDIGEGWTKIDTTMRGQFGKSERFYLYFNPQADAPIYCGTENWNKYGPRIPSPDQTTVTAKCGHYSPLEDGFTSIKDRQCLS